MHMTDTVLYRAASSYYHSGYCNDITVEIGACSYIA